MYGLLYQSQVLIVSSFMVYITKVLKPDYMHVYYENIFVNTYVKFTPILVFIMLTRDNDSTKKVFVLSFEENSCF